MSTIPVGEGGEQVLVDFDEVVGRSPALVNGVEAYLTAGEATELLRVAEKEIRDAHEASKKYEGGRQGDPVLVGEDLSLAEGYALARRASGAQLEALRQKRWQLFDVVRQDETLAGLERVALVGTVFADAPEAWSDRFQETHQALQELDAALQPGTLVGYQPNDSNLDYFVRIGKGGGLKVRVDGISIVLGTGLDKGYCVHGMNRAGYKLMPMSSKTDTGLNLMYFTRDGKTEDFDVLGFLKGERGVTLQVGNEATVAPTSDPARHLARAVAAYDLGARNNTLDFLSEAQRTNLAARFSEAVVKRVTNQEIKHPQDQGMYSFEPLPFMNLAQEELATLGTIARLLGHTHDSVYDIITTAFGKTYEDLDAGKLDPVHLLYAQVAERRRNRFVREMFER